MPLLDFGVTSREMLVDIFAIQEADEDDGIALKSNADAVVADSYAKIILAAFELLEVG